MSLLEIRRLSKSFGGLLAVSNVDLILREGEIHGVIGPNGAGKTTLLNLATGLLRPDGGQIFFNGREITNVPAFVRTKMGLSRTFQITNLFQSFTVRTNLEVAILSLETDYRTIWSTLPRWVTEKAFAIASIIDLSSRFESVVGQLSHGEQRALEIGLALCNTPKLLLLDEPLAGMGPEESEWMVDLIRRIGSEQKTAILIVEHDLSAVFKLAERISVMVYGEVIACGTPDAIRSDPAVQQAYLGT